MARPFNNPARDFLLYPSDERFLRALSRENRELLETATNHGLSYADIAALKRLPIGTVKSRIHRARLRVIALRASSGNRGGRRAALVEMFSQGGSNADA